jgi:hypothetical protein
MFTDSFDGGQAHGERGLAHGDEEYAASTQEDAPAADVNDSPGQAQRPAHGSGRIDGFQRRRPKTTEMFLVV